MITDIIFDFFGTLVSYEASHIHQNFPATHDFLTRHGFHMSYQSFVNSWEATFQKLEAEAQATLREFHMHDMAQVFFEDSFGQRVDEAVCQQFFKTYLVEWNQGVTYFDKIEAFLERLAQNYRISLISNTHYAPVVHNHLQAMGIAEVFTAVTLSATHGWRKPHASIFQDTLDELSVAAQNAIYVGDNFHADYLGAKKLSLNAVLIDPNNKYEIAEKIQHLFELEAYLEKLA